MKLALAFLVLAFAALAAADGGNSGSGGGCKLSDVKQCAPGVKPVQLSNGCPSCIPPTGLLCTLSSARDFCEKAYPTTRQCNVGEQPKINATNCCLTCRIKICTDADKKTCEQNYASLRACNANEDPSWDSTTCCVNCKKVRSDVDGKGECSDAARATCRNTTRVCNAGESPVYVAGSCCGSCKRAEWECSKDQVVTCNANLQPCADTEKPLQIPGNCCPSCKPKDPVCTPACASAQKCVRYTRDNSTGVCVPDNSLRRIRITLVAAAKAAYFAGLNCTSILPLLQEIIARYCDQSPVADKCRAVSNAIAAMILATCNKKFGESRCDIDVDVPTSSSVAPQSFHGFSLQSLAVADNVAAVIAAAVADPAAADGFSITVDQSPASSVVASVSLALAAAALAFFGMRSM